MIEFPACCIGRSVYLRFLGKMRARLLPSLLLLLISAGEANASTLQQKTQAPPRQQSPAGSARLESLLNIQFQPDIRVFTVMAAANIGGFDFESPGEKMSEVRRRVRRQLSTMNLPVYAKLREFYRSHRVSEDPHQEEAAYVSLALLLGDPPNFKLDTSQDKMPADAIALKGFEALVREFYQEADVADLWKQYAPFYRDELKAYRPVLVDVIKESLKYFRIGTRVVLDRRIILIPDLLNARDIVNARNLSHVYFIVVGPADAPTDNFVQLQHEYLHVIVDPLIEKYGAALLEHRDLLKLVQEQPDAKREIREDFLRAATESLIEAVELRLHPGDDPQQSLIRHFRRGLVLVPYFQRGLKSYEEENLLPFPAYLEVMVQNLKDSDIKEDQKTVAQLEAHREESRQQAQQAAHQEDLLRQATSLLRSRQSARAREKLEALLKLEPQNPQAIFYLAQIATGERQHQRAFSMYRQVAENPSAPLWMQGWSLVRMARYLAAQGEFDQSRELFNKVTQMQGDLKGADVEAAKLVKKLP